MRHDINGEPIMTDRQLRLALEALVDLASDPTFDPSEMRTNRLNIGIISDDIFNA